MSTRSPIHSVLHPSIDNPTALAWVPHTEVLVVATKQGELFQVRPVLGTRVIAEGIDETAVVAIHPDGTRVLTLSRAGGWRVGTLDGDERITGSHPFATRLTGFFAVGGGLRPGPMAGDRRGRAAHLVLGRSRRRGRLLRGCSSGARLSYFTAMG